MANSNDKNKKQLTEVYVRDFAGTEKERAYIQYHPHQQRLSQIVILPEHNKQFEFLTRQMSHYERALHLNPHA